MYLKHKKDNIGSIETNLVWSFEMDLKQKKFWRKYWLYRGIILKNYFDWLHYDLSLICHATRILQTITSWAQQKKGGKFKLFVKKNEAKIFKRALEAEIRIREVRLFTKNCGQVSRLLRCAWFFWKWKAEWFPSIPVEQFNCPCSLEEILHFCEYLKYLWIRERMVLWNWWPIMSTFKWLL